MRIRSRIAFVLTGVLASVCVAAAAGAQISELDTLAKTTPEGRAGFLTQSMTSELKLTPAQVPEVQALNLQYAKLQQPLLEKTGGTLSRVRQIKKLNSEKETGLRALLSDTQWSAYEAGRSQLEKELGTWAEAQTTSAHPETESAH
jgi:type II secretory pathway component HofQ